MLDRTLRFLDLLQDELVDDVTAAARGLDFLFPELESLIQGFLFIVEPVGAIWTEVVVLAVGVGHEAVRREVDEATFVPDRGVVAGNSCYTAALTMWCYSNLRSLKKNWNISLQKRLNVFWYVLHWQSMLTEVHLILILSVAIDENCQKGQNLCFVLLFYSFTSS